MGTPDTWSEWKNGEGCDLGRDKAHIAQRVLRGQLQGARCHGAQHTAGGNKGPNSPTTQPSPDPVKARAPYYSLKDLHTGVRSSHYSPGIHVQGEVTHYSPGNHVQEGGHPFIAQEIRVQGCPMTHARGCRHTLQPRKPLCIRPGLRGRTQVTHPDLLVEPKAAAI